MIDNHSNGNGKNEGEPQPTGEASISGSIEFADGSISYSPVIAPIIAQPFARSSAVSTSIVDPFIRPIRTSLSRGSVIGVSYLDRRISGTTWF